MTAEAVVPQTTGTTQNYPTETPPCPAGDYTAASVGGYVTEPPGIPASVTNLVGTRLDPAANTGIVYWDNTSVEDVSVAVWTICVRS
ncbi:hypothetical protein [Streptomyces sp. NPDC002644]